MAGKAGMAVAAPAKVATGSFILTGGGTVWTDKGLSLGLGLGLGAWGPAILGIIGAAAIYCYFNVSKAENI